MSCSSPSSARLDARYLKILATTSRKLAAVVTSADELWRSRQVFQRYGNIRHLLPVHVLKPRSTWAALHKALASRHTPGPYVCARHFLSQERVAHWVGVSHLLTLSA